MKLMLASQIKNVNEDIRFPCLASTKLDGIRCVILDGVAYSRNMKPIRNKYIQSILGNPKYNGLDGELTIGPLTAKDLYRKTSSGVMSIEGEPDFRYNVFDDALPDHHSRPYSERIRFVMDSAVANLIHPVHQVRIENMAQLLKLEEKYLAQGYEGVMVRSIDGPYVETRSSVKMGILLKLKRFQDSEAVVIGFEEKMHNDNPAEVNEIGHTHRSSAKDGLVPMNTLGALTVRDVKSRVEFSIGTGFDDALRGEIWRHRDTYLGWIAKYKSFSVGVKDKPRFPVFLGWRDPADM
jgi:DNA ligase-1